MKNAIRWHALNVGELNPVDVSNVINSIETEKKPSPLAPPARLGANPRFKMTALLGSLG